MPIRPSGSFRRYLIASPSPRPEDETLYEKLRERRFRSIDEQATAEPAAGWIAGGTFGSTDFRPETVFFGPTIVLGIRVDRKRLPSNAVRVRLAEAIAHAGGRMAASEKKRLRNDIEEELLRRAVPSTAVIDLYWRPRSGDALLASTTALAHDLFCSLFRDTFSTTPVPATPTPLSEKVGPPELTAEQLLRQRPILLEA